MSTRANVIIESKRDNQKLYFYRHSDGYPEGTMPTLTKFIEWLRAGKIRNDVSQSAGWLIILGAMEYNTIPQFNMEEAISPKSYGNPETFKEPSDWKVGAYEPTSGIHGDVEYKYSIDLDEMDVTIFERRGLWNKPTWHIIPSLNIGGYKHKTENP